MSLRGKSIMLLRRGAMLFVASFIVESGTALLSQVYLRMAVPVLVWRFLRADRLANCLHRLLLPVSLPKEGSSRGVSRGHSWRPLAEERKQADAILFKLGRTLASHGRPFVILGDWNMVPDDVNAMGLP